jgi:hypothetical protein
MIRHGLAVRLPIEDLNELPVIAEYTPFVRRPHHMVTLWVELP